MREPRNDIVHCAGLCPTTATIFVSRGHWADAHANTQGVYTSILEALYKTWDVHSFPLTAFKTNRCGLLRTFIVASSWLQLNCLRTINKNVFVTAELMQGSWRVATSVWKSEIQSLSKKPSLSSTKFDTQLLGRCSTDLYSCFINLMRIEARGEKVLCLPTRNLKHGVACLKNRSTVYPPSSKFNRNRMINHQACSNLG